MKKVVLFLVFISLHLLGNSQELESKLINSGAWFLFSSRIEQQDGDKVLTKVEFFKKEDVSSLLFDKENKLYSVFSDQLNDMNEDLWKPLDDKTFVITDFTGTTSQIMEIVELTKNKLMIRFCNNSDKDVFRCVTSTYFSTKAGWLPNDEIDQLNSVGIIELAVDELEN